MDLLSHENRIALLEGIDEGKPPNEIADECGVSRQTLQGHIERLKDGKLIEQNQGDDPYRLTDVGKALLTEAREMEKDLVVKSLRESGDTVTAEIRENLQELKQLEEAGVGFDSPFTEEELEHLLEEAEQDTKHD